MYLYEKDCYIYLRGVNTIKVNCDFICIDPDADDNVVMMSVLDASTKIDKMYANYQQASYCDSRLFDRETNENLLSKIGSRKYNLGYKNGMTVNRKKDGMLSHMVMSKGGGDYIFDFEGEDLYSLVLRTIVGEKCVPSNIEMIQEAMLEEPNIIKRLPIISKNTGLKDVKIFRFDYMLYKSTLEEIADRKGLQANRLFYNFEGDFTSYLKHFKDELADNLMNKIVPFYNSKCVPGYVTTFPRPLPNTKMKKVLNQISMKIHGEPFSLASFEKSEATFNAFHKYENHWREKGQLSDDVRYCRQYEMWATGIEILKHEKFIYLAATMGSGKTLSGLKINKYTCEKTLGEKNHLTFILAPTATITQWIGEISLIERGKGNEKLGEDFDIHIIDSKNKFYFWDFYKLVSKEVNGKRVFDKSLVKKPTYVLCGKESFKLSQFRRFAGNPRLDNDGNFIEMKCPSCGGPLVKETKKDGMMTLPFGAFYGELSKKKVKAKGDTDEDMEEVCGKHKKKSGTETLKCLICEKDLNELKMYHEEEFDLKLNAQETGESYEKIYFRNKKTPITSTNWAFDYKVDNWAKRKIFYPIKGRPLKKFLAKRYFKDEDGNEKIKEVQAINSVFPTVKALRSALAKRKAKREELYENVGGYNPIVSEDKKEDFTRPDKLNVKKVSIVEFLKRRPMMFDSMIVDEAHEGNKSSSLIGAAQRKMFSYAKKSILLSGTANNGYASSLHNLLMATKTKELIIDGTFKMKDFINKYGILEGRIKINEDGKLAGKTAKHNFKYKETEGINPMVFTRFLAKNFISVNTLKELDLPLPEMNEKYIPIIADDEVKTSYNQLYSDIREISPRTAETMKSNVLLNFINNPYNWQDFKVTQRVENEITGETEVFEVPIDVRNLDREEIPTLNKDEKVMQIIRQEISEGRKVFLFTEFSHGGMYIGEEEWEDSKKPKKITINDRILKLLKKEGIRHVMLTSKTPETKKRKDWIEARKDKYDVFIAQPQLVNVGLNLVFCPTYIVYCPSYRYDIISQATRRGYRANSTMENRVFHLYYQGTCEEEIINRYQTKLLEAKAIEGEFDVNTESGKNLRTLSQTSATIVGS